MSDKKLIENLFVIIALRVGTSLETVQHREKFAENATREDILKNTAEINSK
jgi:hypothetical protein